MFSWQPIRLPVGHPALACCHRRILEVAGVAIPPILLMHGPTSVLGFESAVRTDVSEIPHLWSLLRGLDVLIPTLRRPHPTHFNLNRPSITRRIGAR
jgi:hypothetical protein